MINYLFRQVDNNQYLLVCMDYNSILNYLDEIERESFIRFHDGELIIDQLLVTGNGRNRFVSCLFSHGKIKIETAKNIKNNAKYKRLSVGLLKQYSDNLDNTILTENQLKMIREGHVIY